MKTASKRLLVPDLIRVTALCLLVLSHISLQSGVVFTGWLKPRSIYYSDWGNGVSLFIVLSGLGLSLKPWKHQRVLAFYRSRIRRIVPVYWVSFVFGCVIYYGFRISNPLLSHSLPAPKEPLHFFCSLTATCPIFGLWGGFILPTGWFLILIFSLYGIYPWLRQFVARDRFLSLAGAFVISLTAAKWLRQHEMMVPLWFFRWFFLSHLFEFMLGISLGLYFAKQTLGSRRFPGLETIVHHVADISFPAFLVHYPLLFVLPLLNQLGYSTFIQLISYLSLVYVVSLLTQQVTHLIAKRFFA